MIKGVNKKVLEINNPQSIYFEKAVLYLKPNMSNAPEKLISREANELIRSMSPKPPKYVFWLKLQPDFWRWVLVFIYFLQYYFDFVFM